jgi:hypothetical protein
VEVLPLQVEMDTVVEASDSGTLTAVNSTDLLEDSLPEVLAAQVSEVALHHSVGEVDQRLQVDHIVVVTVDLALIQLVNLAALHLYRDLVLIQRVNLAVLVLIMDLEALLGEAELLTLAIYLVA